MHEGLHVFVDVLIENTMYISAAEKWPRTHSWHCVVSIQNNYRCTGSDYRLHSHASAFAQSAFIMVQRLSEATRRRRRRREEISTKWHFGCFQVSHLKHASDSYKWLCLMRACSRMLPSYIHVFYVEPIYSRLCSA